MTSLRSRQRGITLLEILASLGIMTAVITGVAKLADQYIADTKTALTAQQMVTVGNAAQAYIKDNYTTVMANATATTPALITIPMLTGAGYLQSGFSTKNNFGQDVCVLVLEPTANNLNALVIAEGGSSIDDLSLGTIAVGIGASGGGVYSSASTTLRGAMGGWSVAVGNYANPNNAALKCDGSAGTPTIAAGHPIMALWFSNGDVTSGFLYRNAVPGRPELNTMNAPIVMNSVQTANSACSATGAIARDSNGAVLSCQAGTWRSQGSSYWKDPVANYAALPASGDPVGAVRMTLDNGRAFMWTGGTWSALAVDQNGNFTASGTILANGRLTTNEYVQINGNATEGAACGSNGLVGRDAAGLLLSCQSGVWLRSVRASGDTMTGRLNNHTNDWGLVLRNGAAADNAAPQDGVGSAYVNDIYIRSIGKWASQLGGSGIVIRDNGLYPFGLCPAGKSFLGAISASGLAAATAEANYWRWPGQVWFCG